MTTAMCQHPALGQEAREVPGISRTRKHGPCPQELTDKRVGRGVRMNWRVNTQMHGDLSANICVPHSGTTAKELATTP